MCRHHALDHRVLIPLGKTVYTDQSGVYYKLAFFSTALFVLPIVAYYYAKDRWLGGMWAMLTLCR